MGLSRRSPLRCGRCGKPRGITHTCVTARPRRGRTRLQNPLEWKCPACGRKRGLRHTCRPRSDFKQRRRKAETAERRRKRQAQREAVRERQRARRKATRERQAARRKQAAADRRARDKARRQAAKTRRAPQSRKRGDSHEPGSCGDRDCPRFGCRAYFEGMENCPLPHGTA